MRLAALRFTDGIIENVVFSRTYMDDCGNCLLEIFTDNSKKYFLHHYETIDEDGKKGWADFMVRCEKYFDENGMFSERRIDMEMPIFIGKMD